MPTLVRNEDDTIGLERTKVIGYRVIVEGGTWIMNVILDSGAEMTYETTASEAEMTPLVTSFINDMEA